MMLLQKIPCGFFARLIIATNSDFSIKFKLADDLSAILGENENREKSNKNREKMKSEKNIFIKECAMSAYADGFSPRIVEVTQNKLNLE